MYPFLPFYADIGIDFGFFQDNPLNRKWLVGHLYPLVNVYITMDNHHALMGKSTISTGPCSSSQTLTNCLFFFQSKVSLVIDE